MRPWTSFAFSVKLVTAFFDVWGCHSWKKSVVPAAFWWLSLAGGLALFSYFVWRRDVIGVLGQSTGVVIYARNLRLTAKANRRARRAPAAGPLAAAGEDPAGEPVL